MDMYVIETLYMYMYDKVNKQLSIGSVCMQ
jgi:hypothetical protein